MAELRIANRYMPFPAQRAFRSSTANVRGYGGAMGGGKSRALCEEALDLALEYPGILLPIFRLKHTAMLNTTRKTFFEQVLPPELLPHVRVKRSQGEDWVELWNGSTIHFAGLDDPIKWFSSELGAAMFDEAHEIAEKDVITIRSRLRQRCRECVDAGDPDCPHMPHTTYLTFNPAEPGHWLQRWLISGASPTRYGFRKEELFLEGSETSAGSTEFVVAKATDNPYLPSEYLSQTLAGMPPLMRQRYLEGLWLNVDGACFFDLDALGELQSAAMSVQPLLVGVTAGDVSGRDASDSVRLLGRAGGGLAVFCPPVRDHDPGKLGDRCSLCAAGEQQHRRHDAHRYVVAVDASSGTAQDWSAIQVVDVDSLEQVAEFQGKVDPDLLAVEAFRLACVYNGALIVPEVTGGWGFAVVKEVQRLLGGWRGGVGAKPRVYTRPIMDRLSRKWTDRLGFDTNVRTRGHILATLEQFVRERQVGVPGLRTVTEMAEFAYEDRGDRGFDKPQARRGRNDDLVLALAIGVTVAASQPRVLRRPVQERYTPQFAATGY